MKTNITRMVTVTKQKRRASRTELDKSTRRLYLQHITGIHKDCNPANYGVARFQLR